MSVYKEVTITIPGVPEKFDLSTLPTKTLEEALVVRREREAEVQRKREAWGRRKQQLVALLSGTYMEAYKIIDTLAMHHTAGCTDDLYLNAAKGICLRCTLQYTHHNRVWPVERDLHVSLQIVPKEAA